MTDQPTSSTLERDRRRREAERLQLADDYDLAAERLEADADAWSLSKNERRAFVRAARLLRDEAERWRR